MNMYTYIYSCECDVVEKQSGMHWTLRLDNNVAGSDTFLSFFLSSFIIGRRLYIFMYFLAFFFPDQITQRSEKECLD